MKKKYLFIDESGEIDFFGKRKRPLWLNPDFKHFTLIGMVVTEDRKNLSYEIQEFKKELLLNPLYNEIYSVRNSKKYFFHARADHPDVRTKFFEFLQSVQGVEFYIIVARKIPDIFISKHNGKTYEFYFDLVNKLINCLPLSIDSDYKMYLAQRQSSTEQRFVESVEKVIRKQFLEEQISYKCDIVMSSEYDELSTIDYALWAVNRYLEKGERRFLSAIEDKIKVIFDVYDDQALNNKYNLLNPFSLDKIAPFDKTKKV